MTDDSPPHLPWSDSFNVGIAALDADHRRLVHLINEVCCHAQAARRDEARQAFETLCTEGAAHFEREEAVLRELTGDGHLAAHTNEHRNRLKQLSRLRGRYEATTEAAEMARICDDLVHWFVRQSIGHDAEIKGFCDDRESRYPPTGGGRLQT